MSNVTERGYESIAYAVIGIVEDVVATYSDILIRMAVSGERRELQNVKHRDNFLSEIDMELHALYRERMADVLGSFVYASEEGEPQIYPAAADGLPDLMVLVDPLDTSELAVRGLSGYTHVLVYSLREQHPVVSVVGDFFHEVRLFYAFRDQQGVDKAYLMTRAGEVFPLRSSQEKDLHKALITNYSMRPRDRFLVLARQQALLDALARGDESGQNKGRIGVDFGSVGLCHVAAGFTDSMIEIAKGFALWDLFPGQYILHAAGGLVGALDGTELPLWLDIHDLADVHRVMERRQKFVAAGNVSLLESILDCLE